MIIPSQDIIQIRKENLEATREDEKEEVVVNIEVEVPTEASVERETTAGDREKLPVKNVKTTTETSMSTTLIEKSMRILKKQFFQLKIIPTEL